MFLRFYRDNINRRCFFLIVFLLLIGFQLQYNLLNELVRLVDLIAPLLKDRLAISIMALAVSCCSIFFGYLTFKRTTEKSVEDDYWLRVVLLPGYLDILKDFIDEISEEVKENGENIYDSDWWVDIQNKMSRKAQLIGVHSDTIYKKIVTLMGFFEDDLNRVFENELSYKEIQVEQLSIELFRKVMLVIKSEQHGQIRLLGRRKKQQT